MLFGLRFILSQLPLFHDFGCQRELGREVIRSRVGLGNPLSVILLNQSGQVVVNVTAEGSSSVSMANRIC